MDLSGDPFHAARPTIETMGDPFDLAGRSNDVPIRRCSRFRSSKITPADRYLWRVYRIEDAMRCMISDSVYNEHEADDLAWRMNRNPQLATEYGWVPCIGSAVQGQCR